MKKLKILLLAIFIPLLGFSQTIESLEYISTYSDGLAAIKKENKWAFINQQGEIVIDFRNDLVNTKSQDGNYPIFKNGRCLIKKVKDGISYFGYLNKDGEIVIEPQFLNALNFYTNVATVLKLVKEDAGKNDLLGKNVVYYKYYEVTIDINGNVIDYLIPEGTNITLDKEFLQKPPKFNTKYISKNVYAILNKDATWTLITMSE